MSYDVSCTSVSTKTQLVCRYCIPATRGAIPHVLLRIDEYLTPFLCHETLTAACEEGASVRTLDFLLEHVAPGWKEAVQAAVRGGHLHVLRWMTERQDGRGPWKDDFDEVLEIAAAHGHLELVQWLYARGIDYHASSDIDKSSAGYIEKSWLYEHCSSHALEAAAEHGHLEVVQWIHGNGTDPCRTYAQPMDRAVVYGHLAVVQWLYTTTSPGRCWTNAIDRAATNGHLELLQWLASKNLFECSAAAMDGAAGNGHLEVVKWLRERNEGCTETALWGAVSNGHLEVARWLDGMYLFALDTTFDRGAWLAAENGHLHCLQWLDDHYPAAFAEHNMETAAKTGHLDVIKWLHDRCKGCTEMAPVRAAAQGHLAILQFLHTHYSETFTPLAMSRAARHGHLDVVLWLLEHRSEGFSGPAMETPQHLEVRNLFSNAESDADVTQIAQLARLEVVFEQRPAFFRGCLRCLAETAVAEGNIDILDWVNQFGIELLSTTPIREAVGRGGWRVVEWFHENGFQVLEPDLLELAVEKGHLEMTRWLFNHGYEITSLRLAEIAGKNGSVPLMRWLVEHGPPLSLSVGTKLAVKYRHVEITRWLAEKDRVKLAIVALRKEERKLLWWLLTRTQFQHEYRRDLIRDAVQCASTDIQLWLQENVAMG